MIIFTDSILEIDVIFVAFGNILRSNTFNKDTAAIYQNQHLEQCLRTLKWIELRLVFSAAVLKLWKIKLN